MKQKLFASFAAFLLLVPVFAQVKTITMLPGKARSATGKVRMTGRVTDSKSGEGLAGANIFCTDDKFGCMADTAGYYVLNTIPTGHHIFEISCAGYSTLVVHLEITGETQKDFALSPVIVENQGVIVTGVSTATSMRKSPVPVTPLKKAALLQIPSVNIIDALSHVPGVSQVSTGPAISKPVIRGLGANRVVTVNDGIRQEGQQWGDEHGIEIDEMSVNKVEILKGPASLMYGSDALAGVVNFITNVPVPENVLRVNWLSNYQANNRLYANNLSVAGNKNGFNWNFYGSQKSAGDYKNKFDGRVLNSRFHEANFGGYAGLNKGWGYSHIIFSGFNQHIGLVEGDRDDATGKFILYPGTTLEHIASDAELGSSTLFIPQQQVQHYKLVSDNSFKIGASRLKLNIGIQQNLRKEFGNPEDPAEKSLFFDLRTFNYNAQWQLPEMNEWHTSIGFNGMQQSNHNKGAEVLIPEYHLLDAGLYVFTQRFFSKTTVSGGLRIDNRHVNSDAYFDGSTQKFTAFTRNFSNVSGSAGVSIEPTDKLTLKLNLARGFRAPTLAELASNGTHEGTNRYEYGTQSLKSETSLQADVGLNLDEEHFSLGFSAFYNRINDFIFYRKLQALAGGDSLVNVDGNDIQAFRFNQQNATLAGLEFTLDIHPHPIHWMHIENNISFVHARFTEPLDGSRNVPLVPAARWTAELRADLKKAGEGFRNFYFSIEADNTFRQSRFFSGYNTETATPAYTLINAGIGADILNARKKTIFSLHLAATNLGDVAWQSHLSRLKYTAENLVTGRTGVFNMGRNFSLKLNVPLEFKLKKD